MATTVEDGAPDIPSADAPSATRGRWRRLGRFFGSLLPKGLFARSLIIIIAPVVLLQALVAFVFVERNWSISSRPIPPAATSTR